MNKLKTWNDVVEALAEIVEQCPYSAANAAAAELGLASAQELRSTITAIHRNDHHPLRGRLSDLLDAERLYRAQSAERQRRIGEVRTGYSDAGRDEHDRELPGGEASD